jgi:hypothetical protein
VAEHRPLHGGEYSEVDVGGTRTAQEAVVRAERWRQCLDGHPRRVQETDFEYKLRIFSKTLVATYISNGDTAAYKFV